MKVLKWAGAVLVVIVAAVVVMITTKKPNAQPAKDVTYPKTPEALARGKYLARATLGCMACHSDRDWSMFGGPVIEERLGAGGECLGPDSGMPGTVCVPNITSHATGIGDWTDGEIARAIREGVDKDGKPMFPHMPYTLYRHIADDDLAALVAYLRTLPPVDNAVPDTKLDFPMSFIVNMIPAPVTEKVVAPPRGETAEYGAYLAKVSGCEFCHTPIDERNQLIEGKEFSGGHAFIHPKTFGKSVSKNITFHSTGMGERTRENFIGMFKAHSSTTGYTKVDQHENTVMHWQESAKMTEEDLGAIYVYLKTVPAIPASTE